MDIKRHLYLIILIILCIGCKPSTYYKIQDDEYHVQLLIRAPGTCMHMLLYNEDGKGKIIRGRTLDAPTEKFRSFYDIEYLSYFEIDTKEDLTEINNIVNTISMSDLTKNSYRLDSRRKEMYIKGNKKYDVYGWKGDELIAFLKQIASHLPYNINSFCSTSSGILVKK